MTSLRPWVLAARPATLWASVAPVLVGGGLAAGDDVFRWDAFVVTLASAVLINIGVNFANDASDARRGVDNAARIGPQRAVASGLITERRMWAGVAVAFGLAAAGGIYLTWIAGWLVVAIGVTSLIAALAYTGGPAPYGYRGWGEVSVFVFFGLAATVGSRYVHDGTAPIDAWLLAIPVGMLATAILVVNNIRDIATDRQAGKHTLAVVLGRRRTRALFTALLYGAFALIAVFAAVRWTPPYTLLALAALPLAYRPARVVSRDTSGPELVGALKATARLHLAVGLLLAVGAAL